MYERESQIAINYARLERRLKEVHSVNAIHHSYITTFVTVFSPPFMRRLLTVCIMSMMHRIYEHCLCLWTFHTYSIL